MANATRTSDNNYIAPGFDSGLFNYMKTEEIITLLYNLSEEYIATNCSEKNNDIAYDLGFRNGIEGFRRYMLYHLRTSN